MSRLSFVPDIEPLSSDEWLELRRIRLSALEESPHAFLSTYERESAYERDQWRAEFIRGSWYVGTFESRTVSLLGATREPDMPVHQCYLEYLWICPGYRRSGVGFGMLTAVLRHLRESGVRTVFLWVLDENEAARRLYRRIGFVSANHRQTLPLRPGHSEERLLLTLG